MAGAALLTVGILVVLAGGQPKDQATADPSTKLWFKSAADAATCSRDTGGTCTFSECYAWRKHATCSSGACMCPHGMCAHQGSCVPPADVPPPLPAPKCETKTGETCPFGSCDSSSHAVCGGFAFSFTKGISLGDCVCAAGQCAVDGKCVDSPQLSAPPANLNANKIVCPVLASLYNAGFLKPDAYGRVERLQLQKGIRVGLNSDDITAWFFGQTTAGFTEADVDQTNFDMANLAQSLKLLKEKATEEPNPEDRRYLNIFKMGSSPAIMHQIAAAVRGGAGLVDHECESYPCLQRYDEFWAKFATPEGRIYTEQLGEALCNIFRNGFHGVATSNFFTLTQGFTGREYLAVAGWIVAFGHADENGQLYLTVNDTRTMEMNGVFPKDWTPTEAPWGGAQVLAVQDAWRKQGVCGLSTSAKMTTLMKALTIGTPAAIEKAFESPL